eukprot:765697_1
MLLLQPYIHQQQHNHRIQIYNLDPSPLDVLLAKLLCDNGHPLSMVNISDIRKYDDTYKNGFICDKCAISFDYAPSLQSWHCTICPFDLCLPCYSKKDPSSQQLYDDFIQDIQDGEREDNEEEEEATEFTQNTLNSQQLYDDFVLDIQENEMINEEEEDDDDDDDEL